MYWCYHADGTQPTGGCPICADGPTEAENICQSGDFLNENDAYAVEEPCFLPISGCSGWSPTSEVTYNTTTGHYEIDQTFIDSVLSDPNQLECDSAKFTRNTSGDGFGLSGASSGELLYELGFRNGDVPTSINSYSLDDAVEVAAAVVALSYSDPSSYTIQLIRPTQGTMSITVDVQ